ncbi:MAG TPA: hypothetical protein PK467_05155 [Candidatus Wallbacteria bacterium]|nr:hypothetical protein [Candidatus Wallbacteria bacterium]
MKSKVAFLILAIFFSFFCKFISPLYSQPEPDYSELTALKPFSENSNYMSIEGYIALRHKINTGETLTRSQAKRIYKRFAKLDDKNSNINQPLIKSAGKDTDKILHELTNRLNSIRSQNARLLEKNKFTKILFLNFSKDPKDIRIFEYINHYAKKRFESNKTLSLNFNDKIFTDFNLCIDNLSLIARNNNADMIVCNSLIGHKKRKKLNIAGSYIDFWFFGLENRFNISLSTIIYDARANNIKFKNSASVTKKHRVFGLFHGHRGVMTYAIKQVVDKLYKDFNF